MYAGQRSSGAVSIVVVSPVMRLPSFPPFGIATELFHDLFVLEWDWLSSLVRGALWLGEHDIIE